MQRRLEGDLNNNNLRQNKHNKHLFMDKDSDDVSMGRPKKARDLDKSQSFSTKSCRQENQNKQSFYNFEGDTKASSHLSSGTHQTSFEFSESSFDNERIRAQDFFREQFILQRKVLKKELILRQEYFSKQFAKHAEDLLAAFTCHPNTSTFQNLLQNLMKSGMTIFQTPEPRAPPISSKLHTFKSVMESLIFQRKNWFFIYTFDLLVCNLAFFIVLIAYWIQAQCFLLGQKVHILTQADKKESEEIDRKVSTKHNIISIVKAYVRGHIRQINQNQALLLMVVYFIDALKLSNHSESETLENLQKDLVRDVKILRKIQRKQRNFVKPSTESIMGSKIKRIEQSHFFITSSETTYQLIRSQILENFSSETINKFYQFDNESRKAYQSRKDMFCLWVLDSIMSDGELKSSIVLRNASLYIVQIMGMLKKFKKQNNIQGISYLLPIVANLKECLPKVWRHVIKRRPEIEKKFDLYNNLMVQNKVKLDRDGVIWGETVYIMAERMMKCIKNKKGIDLDEHQKYYDQFLFHLFFYKDRARQLVSEPMFQFNSEHETKVGFNLAQLENHLINRYSKMGAQQYWSKLAKKAEKINQSISESLIADIFDYWFVGSTQKYKRVDL